MKRGTILSGLDLKGAAGPPTLPIPISTPPLPQAETAEPTRRARPDTVQQTLYLPPAVHDQLRDLAHVERVKMHALVMEGLDAVFRARGLKGIADLIRKP